MPPAPTPVELHIVSDSTGETAARLVQALEAQFPDQPFEEVRHPRVESLDDLRIAVSRMKGRPAVAIYTLVEPEFRDTMRQLCRRAKVHYADLLGHPIESVARVSGQAAKMRPGARAPLNSAYFKRMEAIEFAVIALFAMLCTFTSGTPDAEVIALPANCVTLTSNRSVPRIIES